MLTGLHSVACSAGFGLYTLQNYLPRGGTARSGLDPPKLITELENASKDLPAGQSDRGIFSIHALAFQRTLAHAKLGAGLFCISDVSMFSSTRKVQTLPNEI